MDVMQVLIITGMSGAGKSTVIDILEDRGYFCVDNLPPKLLPVLFDLCRNSEDIRRLALGIDIRGGRFFADLDEVIQTIKTQPDFDCRIIFMEADDEVLIRRYKESRRLHPLCDGQRSLSESIEEEREMLKPLSMRADFVLDTSTLRPLEMRERIIRYLDEYRKGQMMNINLLSFGFKHGIPLDADIVLDVRFLPNPYYEEHLRPLRGIDQAVQDFIWQYPLAQTYLAKVVDLLEFSIPQYELEGKTQLTIAIGCTGGHHRSVAFVNKIHQLLQSKYHALNIIHRDINK